MLVLPFKDQITLMQPVGYDAIQAVRLPSLYSHFLLAKIGVRSKAEKN